MKALSISKAALLLFAWAISSGAVSVQADEGAVQAGGVKLQDLNRANAAARNQGMDTYDDVQDRTYGDNHFKVNPNVLRDRIMDADNVKKKQPKKDRIRMNPTGQMILPGDREQVLERELIFSSNSRSRPPAGEVFGTTDNFPAPGTVRLAVDPLDR